MRTFGTLLLAMMTMSPAFAGTVDISSVQETPKKGKWDPKGKAITPYGQSNAPWKRDDWEEAATKLVEALEAQPGMGKALRRLAIALAELDQRDDALAIAEQLATLFPDKKDAWSAVYTARLTVKAWNRALAAADTLIEMDPDKLRYHLQKQDVYLLTGRYEEAAAALEAAKDVLDEKDLACANVKMHAASGDPESGHEAWELCKDSENSSLRNAAEGWLALADGDLSLAVKRATDLGDRDQIQMALGLLRVEEGKLDAANNLLSALVEERPKAADARIHYAMVLSELGKSDEALTQLAVTYGDGWKDNVDAALTDAVLTARGESWIKSQLQEGAALLASLHKDAGADDSATSVCADAKALWPDAAAVTEACAAPTPE